MQSTHPIIFKFTSRNLAHQCLYLLLRPIVRFCLRRSIKYSEFVECAKQLFCHLAQEECCSDDQEPSVSKISIITGINRREVTRLKNSEVVGGGQSNLIAKIIGKWQSKPYRNVRGRIKSLNCDSKTSEFATLVNSVSRDLNPYTVLFELERTGCVSRSGNKVKLAANQYIPKGKALEGYQLLSEDLDLLLEGVEENILEAHDLENLHLRTFYDNISPKDVTTIKRWLLAEGKAFHRRARAFISQFDRDESSCNPTSDAMQVSVGTFSFVKPNNSSAEH